MYSDSIEAGSSLRPGVKIRGKIASMREESQVILRECSCQSEETLEEHFSSLNRKYLNGQGTLALIEGLRSYCDDRIVFCLTQIDRLILLSQDDYTTPWWVVITSHGLKDYQVDCRMPQNQSPWRGARITGTTKKIERALEMVIKALTVSRGWNSELGGAPIGLDEIVEEALSLFRFKDAEQDCRALMGQSKSRSLFSHGGDEVLLTLLGATGSDENLAYRHDSTTDRWGLVSAEPEGSIEDVEWYFSMDDAFCRSQAWEGAPPPARLVQSGSPKK